MAEFNKSQEIRKTATYMKCNGERLRPILIIKSLEKQGIVVSSPHVSTVLKTMGFPARKNQALLSISDLMAAKTLVSSLGGIERATAAISALKRLQSKK